MPDQVIPVAGLDTIGLVVDTPPVSLPEAALSDCLNVRFRDGAIEKMEGDANILPYLDLGSEDILRYVAWWPNPNLAPFNLGYYLVIVEQAIVQGRADNAYLLKVDELGSSNELVTLSNASDSFKGEFLIGGNWQHTFFQGGFALIVNNGLQTPRFILDPSDNDKVADVPDFVNLPGWDSYALQQTTGNRATFNGDGLIDTYTLSAGTTLPTDAIYEASFVSIDGVEIPLDASGLGTEGYTIFDNTIKFETNVIPKDGDQIIVIFNTSVTIATVTAGVVRTFGDNLVAGNLVERATVEGVENVIVRALPGVVRTSDIAAPGAVPQNWNPFNTGANTADELTITNEGIVQDFVELQGNLFVYSNSSISTITRTGNGTVPFSVRPVTPAWGALTTDSVIEFDGRHFVVGAQDIYIFGGHPGSIKSVADGKVREYFYDNLSPVAVDSVFILQYQQKDEIWICYPNRRATSRKVNEALIWNYRKDNWTKRDIPDAVAGDVGPVPGGGLPSSELTIMNSPEANTDSSPGIIHTNTISQTARQGIRMSGDGIPHQFEVIIKPDMPVVGATSAPSIEVELLADFYTGVLSEEEFGPLVIRARARDTDTREFLLIPNGDGTSRPFNFSIPVPKGLGSATGEQDVTDPAFRANVLFPLITMLETNRDFTLSQETITNPPMGFPTNAFTHDPTAAMSIEVLEATANNVFIVRFETIVAPSNSYDIEFTMEAIRDVTEIDNLTLEDRRGDEDIAGVISTDEGTEAILIDGVPGTARVFIFDFDHLVDRMTETDDPLTRHSFLFGAQSIGRDAGGQTLYAPLPEGAVVRKGTPNSEDLGPLEDGGDTDDGNPNLDGGGVNDGASNMDGDRRVNYDFTTMPEDITEPLLGSRVLQFLTEGDVESTQYPFQLWIPDTQTAPAEFHLITYEVARASDGVPAIMIDNVPEDTLSPPTFSLTFQEESYTADSTETCATYSWKPDGDIFQKIEVFGFVTDLPPDADTTSMYAQLQRATYAMSIVNRFITDPHFTATVNNRNGDMVVTLVGRTRAAWGITAAGFLGDISTKTISGDPINVGFEDTDHIQITELVQGKYDYFNTPAIDPAGRQLVPPSLCIRHTDPSLEYFNFETRIELVGADNQDLTYDDWLTIIGNGIVTATSNMRKAVGVQSPWSSTLDPGEDIDISSIANIWNEMLGDTGIPNPDLDPTNIGNHIVSFPEERRHANFQIIGFNEGSGFATDDLDFLSPTSIANPTGAYPVVQTGSYLALLVSDSTKPFTASQVPNEAVYIFYLGGLTGDVNAALAAEMSVRVPRLNTTVGGTSVNSIPSNYNEEASFVIEALLNNTANLGRFRELLNPTTHYQDPFNPNFDGGLPFRVQDTNHLFTYVLANDALTLESNISILFDTLRPWPREEVNFTIELPIFAATRLWGDGRVTNKVIGSDIGFSRPTFVVPSTTRTETINGSDLTITGQDAPEAYESFVERVQMGLTPEFTTETLRSVALWADGSTRRSLRGPETYNALRLTVQTSDNPGQRVDYMGTSALSNTLFISEDYKVDMRNTGRFLNWRISDAGVTYSDPVKFNQISEWRLSGLQFDIGAAGRR